VHWSEVAYVVAMAWAHGGEIDSSLETAALQLLAGHETRARRTCAASTGSAAARSRRRTT
jgi:hypothetical protein